MKLHAPSLTRRLLPWVFVALTPLAALAEEAGKHPAYLHALTDMRTARGLLEPRPGDQHADEEVQAIGHLDAAIRHVEAASAKDGKGEGRVPSDDKLDHESRLRQAESLMSKARSDIDEKEDDPKARQIRAHAVQELDKALHDTREAIYNWHKKK